MRSDAPLGTLPDRGGNLDAAGVRIVNPSTRTHDSSPLNFRVQVKELAAEEIGQLRPYRGLADAGDTGQENSHALNPVFVFVLPRRSR